MPGKIDVSQVGLGLVGRVFVYTTTTTTMRCQTCIYVIYLEYACSNLHIHDVNHDVNYAVVQ
jgi:hypothetical protein